MAEIQGQPIPPHIEVTPGILHAEIELLGKIATAARAGKSVGEPQADHLRGRVLEIGARAEGLQKAACRARAAVDALSEMENALAFALEAAREARHARTLPTALLARLQTQVDLAICCVDWHGRSASFGGSALFTGGQRIEVEGDGVDLPRLSAEHIGGDWVARGEPWRVETGEVEYSQSIASVGTGCANSLENWPEGAALALESGLAQVRRAKADVEGFYESKVLAAVRELAVTLSNAIAAEPSGASLDQAAALLEAAGSDLTDVVNRNGDGKGILRLLG